MKHPAPTTSVVPHQPTIMVHDGRAVTTSKAVADYFGKKHKNVLRDIENLIADLPNERGLNFAPTFQTVAGPNNSSRQERMFELTRDGFMLLTMGFTGKQALTLKVGYIDAFNQMESQLRTPPLPSTNLPQLADLAEQFTLTTEALNSPTLSNAQRWELASKITGALFGAEAAALLGRADSPLRPAADSSSKYKKFEAASILEEIGDGQGLRLARQVYYWFADDKCRRQDGEAAAEEDLYLAFCLWFEHRFAYPPPPVDLFRALLEKYHRPIQLAGKPWYLGIALKVAGGQEDEKEVKRRLQEMYRRFFADNCRHQQGAVTSDDDLYRAFCPWYERLFGAPPPALEFLHYLLAEFYGTGIRMSRATWYTGIVLNGNGNKEVQP